MVLPPALLAPVLLALTILVAITGVPAAQADPGTPEPPEPCSNHETPPGPISPSEEPAPGEDPPDPLPVPEEPIGGERLGECGEVLPPEVPGPPEEITAAAWMISDLDSGEVLAARDPHGRHRPASLIKVLLAATVVDELDPDETVIASEDDTDQVCTCVGLVTDEEYTVEDLLTGTLIHSGNDAAHALGSALGGKREALEAMNGLATRLMALDTRAATTSGLDGPGMTSSAYDLSLIFRHALEQPRFVEAIGTRNLDFTLEDDESISLYNDNRLLGSYEGFIGGKTGYTNAARHTYMGAAERGDRRVAVVLLHAEQRPVPVHEQAAAALDYGFALAGEGVAPVGELVPPLQEGEGSLALDDDMLERDGEGFVHAILDGERSIPGMTLGVAVAGVALVGIVLIWRSRRDRLFR
ncbi:peptidase M15 [Haloechinothrix sp. LS1_15]|nr:peptidase M15 [Haloechinothrix sp. LS1_15]